MKIQSYLIFVLLSTLLLGCKSKQDQSNSDNWNQWLITKKGINGISPKGFVRDIPKQNIEKEILPPGNGTFRIHKIISNNGEVVGTFSPLSVDTSQIGSLKITNPTAVTKEGIHIGSTFGDIKNVFEGYEIFSDWITQLAAVSYENYFFNLDFPLKQEEIGVKEIDDEAKVVEIWVHEITSN